MAASTSEVSVDVYDHGKALDIKKRKVKCNYCGKVVSGFFRLKQHIGGIRGNVISCEQAAPHIKELMCNSLLKNKKATTRNEVENLQNPHSKNIKSAKLEVPSKNVSRSKRQVEMGFLSEANSMGRPAVSLRKIGLHTAVHKDIGRFFFMMGADFSAVESPSFQIMMKGLQLPSLKDLKGWILEDEVKEMQLYAEGVKQSWRDTGCSILLDVWVDGKDRNLINFLVDCPKGAVYLRSADISASIGDVDALLCLFEGVLLEVGVENVLQMVSYSSKLDCIHVAGKQLQKKYKSVFWTVSASHCIELMLQEIEMMGSFKDILDKAKSLTRFIYNHAMVLELLRNYTDGKDLVKPSKIRSASSFLTLENILLEEENLKKMFSSSEWSRSIWASKMEGKKAAYLMGDHSFWTGALKLSKVAIPLVRVLCLINEDDKHRVDYIYETFDQVKETICDAFGCDEALYMPFWDLIDNVWDNRLHNPLHSAGYFFNPSLKYSSDFSFDSEVGGDVLFCIINMARDLQTEDKVYQFDHYRLADGIFCEGGDAMENRNNFAPVMWWSKYAGQHPELQRFAIRVLSQTCNGASRYMLKRSLAEKLLTKGRNRLEQHRLRDLTFVHYNLHLKNFKSGTICDSESGEIDPMNDWIADETNCDNVDGETDPMDECVTNEEQQNVCGPQMQSGDLEWMEFFGGEVAIGGEGLFGAGPSGSTFKVESM